MNLETAKELARVHPFLVPESDEEGTYVLVCTDCRKRARSGSRVNSGRLSSTRAATAHVALHERQQKPIDQVRGTEALCRGGHGSAVQRPAPVSPSHQSDLPGDLLTWEGQGQAGTSAHACQLPVASRLLDVRLSRMLDATHADAVAGRDNINGEMSPLPTHGSDVEPAAEEDQMSGSLSADVTRGVPLDSDDSGQLPGSDAEAPLPPLECGPLTAHDVEKAPRKGSGADLYMRRLQPIADGHRRSILSAAYSLVEVKQHGASNVVLDKMAMNQYLLFNEFKDPSHVTNVNLPKSLHLVKAVLGTEDASKYEFGCCPKCAWRYDADPHQEDKTKAALMQETCPQCATPKYQVLSTDRIDVDSLSVVCLVRTVL